jgi:hypothetical protein
MASKPKPLSVDDEAKRIAPEHTQTFMAEIDLVIANVRRGAESLGNARSLIESQLKQYDASLATRYSAIATALGKAVAQVAYAEKGVNLELAQALERMWPIRKRLLATAELASLNGLIPSKTFEKIVQGRGTIDASKDVLELVDLVRKHWETIGQRWGVSKDDLDAATAVAETVRKHTKPARARPMTDAQLKAARLHRDRLFTLLANTRTALWKAAAVAFGEDEIHEKFPALQAQRRVVSKPAPDAPEPAKAAKKGKRPLAPPLPNGDAPSLDA